MRREEEKRREKKEKKKKNKKLLAKGSDKPLITPSRTKPHSFSQSLEFPSLSLAMSLSLPICSSFYQRDE